jgi:hypothetical protein
MVGGIGLEPMLSLTPSLANSNSFGLDYWVEYYVPISLTIPLVVIRIFFLPDSIVVP